MVSEKKLLQTQKFIELLQKSKNFSLVTFEKTLHSTLETLRKELRQHNAKLQVVKNSLLEKALNKLSSQNKDFADLKKEAKSLLKKNSALLFLDDEWSRGLAAFYKFTKKEQSITFKLGFLDKKVYQNNELIRMAQLPSREELIAKVIGGMKTPISKFNYAIKFNMQKFVYILSEKSKQGGELV